MITKRKKIAYINSKFPRNRGTFEIREMRELKRMGVDIYIFSLRKPKTSPKLTKLSREFEENIFYCPYFVSRKLIISDIEYIGNHWRICFSILKFIIIVNWKTPLILFNILILYPKAIFYSKLMKELRCDHIHAHFVSSPGSVALICSLLTGIPYSCTAHGSDIYQYPYPDLPYKINSSCPFLTISNCNREYFKNTYNIDEKKIKVVHCGIDFNEVPKYVRTTDKSKIFICSIASLREIKGLGYLIKACNILHSRGRNFYCEMIGDGPEKTKLRKMIVKDGLKEKVHLKPSILPEDVFDYLRNVDIFVLPSLREGIPVSVMEAMALEIPVVCTSVYGLPELVENGSEGLLVPPADEKALANAIDFLMQNPDKRILFGQNGKKKVEKDFNAKAVAKELYKYFLL